MCIRDRACAGDEGLRREVESLLAYEGRVEQFMPTPALDTLSGGIAGEPARVPEGQGYASGPRCSPEVSPCALRGYPGCSGEVPARGAGYLVAEPSEHLHPLRSRGTRGSAVPGDGTDRGRIAQAAAGGWRTRGGRSALHYVASVRRSGGGSHQGRRAPGHQTGQHLHSLTRTGDCLLYTSDAADDLTRV